MTVLSEFGGGRPAAMIVSVDPAPVEALNNAVHVVAARCRSTD
jgi:hypothetical protein